MTIQLFNGGVGGDQITSSKDATASTTIGQTFGNDNWIVPPVDSLIVWIGSGRDVGNNETLTVSNAYIANPTLTATLVGYTTPMERHTAGIGYYNRVDSDGFKVGSTDASEMGVTFSQSADNRNAALAAFESTLGKLELDTSSFNGSGATNASSIQPGSTGTLSGAEGDEWLVIVVGQSRTANAGLSIDGTGWTEWHTSTQIDAGSQNTTAWYKVVTADTALNPTVSESNGASRMGAGIAVFRVPASGGGPTTVTGTASGTISASGTATGTVFAPPAGAHVVPGSGSTATDPFATQSPSFTLNVAPQEGDLIVVYASASADTAVADPSGWTNVLGPNVSTDPGDGSMSTVMLYRRVSALGAGTTTWTLTNLWSSGGRLTSISAVVVRNAASTGELVGTATATDAADNATPWMIPSVTPTNNDALVIAGVAGDDATTQTAPTGWTAEAAQAAFPMSNYLHVRGAYGSNGVATGSANVAPSFGNEYVTIVAAFTSNEPAPVVTGTAAGTISASGTASATSTQGVTAGTAAGTASVAGTATGTVVEAVFTGTAAGTVAVTGTATGSGAEAVVAGTASGTISVVGVAVGDGALVRLVLGSVPVDAVYIGEFAVDAIYHGTAQVF